MSYPVSIVLVGIEGYGNTHVNALLNYEAKESLFIIKGIVDPYPDGCKRFAELRQMEVPMYGSLGDFYEASSADLAVISSPIQYHASQACLALSKGSHVLCEKPISATIQDALRMEQAHKRSGKLLEIGYQWSFSDVIQELKKDVLHGVFGKPRRFRTMVCWPRDKTYFSRSWAGKLKDAQGNWVLDSVAHNATAHYLHNMFYVLGETPFTSTRPKNVQAELYRANFIENYDTAFIRVQTESDVELLFYSTHATKERHDPSFVYEFELGDILFGERETAEENQVIARFHNGEIKEYGNPNENRVQNLWSMIHRIGRGEPVVPICGPRAAMSLTLCINGIQEACGEIRSFPKELVEYDEAEELIYVKGLEEIMVNSYEQSRLPSDQGVPWSHLSPWKNLTRYQEYKGVNER